MVDDGLAAAASYDDRAAAERSARSLVEAGIGADVREQVLPGDGDGPATSQWRVEVLRDDLARACQHLGVEPLDELPEDDAPTGTPWKAIVAIWLVAMIVVPLFAFWLTVRLNS